VRRESQRKLMVSLHSSWAMNGVVVVLFSSCSSSFGYCWSYKWGKDSRAVSKHLVRGLTRTAFTSRFFVCRASHLYWSIPLAVSVASKWAGSFDFSSFKLCVPSACRTT